MLLLAQGMLTCFHFMVLLLLHTWENIYRWVPLKPDFLGALKSVWLNHYPAYPIIIISLIIQRNLATKIQAKQESGLTAVQLKWDPPVILFMLHEIIFFHIDIISVPSIDWCSTVLRCLHCSTSVSC